MTNVSTAFHYSKKDLSMATIMQKGPSILATATDSTSSKMVLNQLSYGQNTLKWEGNIAQFYKHIAAKIELELK